MNTNRFNKFSYSTIASVTGFSTPWTQRMIAAGKGRHLTVAQVAERTNLCKVYLYKMINAGKLSAHKFNGRTCITLRNLAIWRLQVAA